MGTAIASSTIESQAYANVYEVIDNRSNVVDPKQKDMTNASTQKRAFVYDADPFDRAVNHDGMPYIVLDLPVVEDIEESHSMDGKYEIKTWAHRIIVRAKRDISNSPNVNTDRGRIDMLEICDDLQETFKSRAVRDTLMGYNMAYVTLSKVRQDVYPLDGSKDVYEAEYRLGYKTRLQVST